MRKYKSLMKEVGLMRGSCERVQKLLLQCSSTWFSIAIPEAGMG